MFVRIVMLMTLVYKTELLSVAHLSGKQALCWYVVRNATQVSSCSDKFHCQGIVFVEDSCPNILCAVLQEEPDGF